MRWQRFLARWSSGGDDAAIPGSGFLPVFDENKCVHCGKCLQVCPMNVEVNKESRKRKNATGRIEHYTN